MAECLIRLIRSCRNKVQVCRSVRMPQLHTSLHFHDTYRNDKQALSRRDLLLNSQKNFCRSIPAGTENPSLSRLCYRKLWGSQRNGESTHLGVGLLLRCFQQLSAPHLATQRFTVGTITGTRVQLPSAFALREPISVRPESLARLRYLLGGLCPIETVYLRLSLGP
ncbi:hypothetical protein HAX54_025961 [Datura stramonium]|uniref:Uncharacterized protein n=1 Tax=Datura stramonium TaxID=4076 RepID=A0ABS8V2V9_DATST|nr:hypothetical protein [Datura stramonium]